MADDDDDRDWAIATARYIRHTAMRFAMELAELRADSPTDPAMAKVWSRLTAAEKRQWVEQTARTVDAWDDRGDAFTMALLTRRVSSLRRGPARDRWCDDGGFGVVPWMRRRDTAIRGAHGPATRLLVYLREQAGSPDRVCKQLYDDLLSDMETPRQGPTAWGEADNLRVMLGSLRHVAGLEPPTPEDVKRWVLAGAVQRLLWGKPGPWDTDATRACAGTAAQALIALAVEGATDMGQRTIRRAVEGV